MDYSRMSFQRAPEADEGIIMDSSDASIPLIPLIPLMPLIL